MLANKYNSRDLLLLLTTVVFSALILFRDVVRRRKLQWWDWVDSDRGIEEKMEVLVLFGRCQYEVNGVAMELG